MATHNVPHPDLVTEAEAAHALGVSRQTLKVARLHSLSANALRDLPYVRIGRNIRYRRRDLVEWIERHTVYPEDSRA